MMRGLSLVGAGVLCLWPMRLAGAPERGAAAPGEVPSWQEGLVTVFTMEGSLVGENARGEGTRAEFLRNAPAFFPDLARVEAHVPRLVKGRFGQGVLIEYSLPREPSPTNAIPRARAMVESLEGFQALGGAEILRVRGPREGFGAVEIRGGEGAGVERSFVWTASHPPGREPSRFGSPPREMWIGEPSCNLAMMTGGSPSCGWTSDKTGI
jgi:hypothetical protein